MYGTSLLQKDYIEELRSRRFGEVWRSRQGELKGQTNGGKCGKAREILKHLPSA